MQPTSYDWDRTHASGHDWPTNGTTDGVSETPAARKCLMLLADQDIWQRAECRTRFLLCMIFASVIPVHAGREPSFVATLISHSDRANSYAFSAPMELAKSTLLRTIAGMQPPLQGKVLLCRKLLAQHSPRYRLVVD